MRFRGTISDGAWRIDEPLSAQTRAETALRTGSVHSYTQFTGYLPHRVRGEMRSARSLRLVVTTRLCPFNTETEHLYRQY